MLIIFNILCLFLVILSFSYSRVTQCRLMVAYTPEERARGLMGYRSLPDFDGMVFLYKDKEIRHFWNKNTHLELDVYWIKEAKVVGRSYLPPVELAGIVVVSSPEPVDRVVELLRGTKCVYEGILLSPELEGSKGKDAKKK